ncbi:hypothetical protein [Anthocerotibacter panamensis]|uniref:hypothetical protein n=1 Tax=Anthocerotibacter panamensis TaxID=2857077 RepID=UPI001C4054BE|nr:hypothetical protein [Anthocerotibacter panamensis]
MAIFDMRGQQVTYQWNISGDAYFGTVENKVAVVQDLDRLRADRRRERAQVMAAQNGEAVEQVGERLFAQGLRWFEQEHVNVLAEQAWANGIEDWEQVRRLAGNLVVFFQLRSQWSAWEASHLLALEATQQAGDRQGEGITLKNLGHLHKARGAKERAVSFWREALTKLHPDSPEYRKVEGLLGGEE